MLRKKVRVRMSFPLCTVMHIKIYVVLEFLDYCKGKSQNSES